MPYPPRRWLTRSGSTRFLWYFSVFSPIFPGYTCILCIYGISFSASAQCFKPYLSGLASMYTLNTAFRLKSEGSFQHKIQKCPHRSVLSKAGRASIVSKLSNRWKYLKVQIVSLSLLLEISVDNMPDHLTTAFDWFFVRLVRTCSNQHTYVCHYFSSIYSLPSTHVFKVIFVPILKIWKCISVWLHYNNMNYLMWNK